MREEMKKKIGQWKTVILHNLEAILTEYDANILVRKFAARLRPNLIISVIDERSSLISLQIINVIYSYFSCQLYEIKLIVPICFGFCAEDKFQVTLKDGEKTKGKLFKNEIGNIFYSSLAQS